MQIEVDGGQVSASVQGQGPTLVLFHSLLSDAASFDRIAPLLAAHFRVVVPDLPGFGGSSAIDRGGLPAVADRMAAAVRKITPDEKPIVLGNGFGGFVALQMVIRHPDLAERLVVADAGACFSEPGRQAFRNMATAARGKGLPAITDVAMRRLFAPNFQAENPDLMEDRRAAFERTDIEMFIAACDALATLDLRPSLSGVALPVLVLVGEGDEATPPPMSEELARLLPNATFKMLPGLAHVPQMQAPDVFLDAIDVFLKAPAPV
jgi:3-oxoadipate enol-lactonase